MDLLETLCTIPGVSGFEDEVQRLVMAELEGVCDKVWRDRVGNVIGLKRAAAGNEKARRSCSPPLDEIGLMVTHIDADGFIRFTLVGGFDACNLIAQRVIVHGRRQMHGVIAPRILGSKQSGERPKAPELADLYIDLALRDEVAANVEIGDVISLDQDFRYLNDQVITGRNFDDRLGVYCMIEAMKRLGPTEVDVYAVSTVQEELGVRGAPMAAYAIEPDFGIAIDGSLAWDVPNIADHEKHCTLGQGTGILCHGSADVGQPAPGPLPRRTVPARGPPLPAQHRRRHRRLGDPADEARRTQHDHRRADALNALDRPAGPHG